MQFACDETLGNSSKKPEISVFEGISKVFDQSESLTMIGSTESAGLGYETNVV